MTDKKVKEVKLPQVITKNVAVTIVLSLVVGFIVGYIVSSMGGNVATSTVEDAVQEYVTENFLQAQGAEAEITSVEQEFGLYLVNFDIVKDGEVLQQAQTYTTKDGKYMIIGQAFDMTEAVDVLDAGGDTAAPSTEIPKTDKPNVKMFVMTYCPFGQQAEKGLGPALAELGDSVDWEPHFVIYENYRGGGPDYCFDEDSKYCSMHGIDELNEGVRQLCIYRDNKAKWWDYVNKINEQCQLADIEECWKTVAKQVALDTDKIEKCVEEDGMEILAAEAALNEQYGVRGSPTIIINDAEYSGGRAPGDYLAGICSGFNTEPDACSAELSTSGAAASGGCG